MSDFQLGLENLFLGYRPLSVGEILNQYQDRDKECNFFGSYSVDEDYNLAENEEILLYEDRKELLDEPIEIDNLSKYVPIFSFQGDFILANMASIETCELIVITYGYDAGILAPSFTEHFDNLLLGLETEKYFVTDGNLIYPTSWYQRIKVVAGDAKMTENGEVVD